MSILDRYRKREYRIKTESDDGSCVGSDLVTGYDLGPFAVRDTLSSKGRYNATHLHSGLCLVQISFASLEDTIGATEELLEIVPVWSASKPSRVAELNGLTLDQLKVIVFDISKKYTKAC